MKQYNKIDLLFSVKFYADCNIARYKKNVFKAIIGLANLLKYLVFWNFVFLFTYTHQDPNL